MKFFGKATIKADGQVLESMPGSTLDPGGKTRTPVSSDHSHGYHETPKPSSLECEIKMTKDTSLAELAAITDATLSFDCDTGQSYVIRKAWLVEPPILTSGDNGTVKLQFAGDPADEVK